MASRFLSEKTGTRVSIGGLRLNMLGRVILDNVTLYDQRDTLMLQASRIAAKVDLLPLIEKQVRISGAQVISANAKLYKDGNEPFNFQFLIDAFSSKDTTTVPLDLKLGAFVVQNGDVRFDRLDKPTTPERFNPSHLHLTDLNLTARVIVKVPDTVSVNLHDLSFREQSGLHLKRLSFEAEAGKHNASVREFRLELPETNIHANSIQASVKDGWTTTNGTCPLVTGNVCLRDLSCFVPRLATFGDIINLSSEVRLENGNLQVKDLCINDNAGNLSLLCNAVISDLKDAPSIYADIKELRTGPTLQQFLTQNLQGQAKEVSPIFTRLGGTRSTGTVVYHHNNKVLQTNLHTESEQGSLSVNATLTAMQDIKADIAAKDIRLGHLLNLSGEGKGTATSLEATVTGTFPGKGRAAKLLLAGSVGSLMFRGYEHQGIHFTAAANGDAYSGEMSVDEPDGKAHILLQTAKQQSKRSLQCQMQVTDFAPHKMNLTKRYEGERFSGLLDADFSDLDPADLQGELRLTGLELASEEKGTLRVGDIVLSSSSGEDKQSLLLQSDFLNVKADGDINWKTLPASFVQPVRQNLPSLFQSKGSHPQPSGNDFRFLVQLQDTVLAERLLGSSLRLPEGSTLAGSINDAIEQVSLHLQIPQMRIGGQQLQNIVCRTETGSTYLRASTGFKRIVKGNPVEISLDASAQADKVTSRLRWNNKSLTAYTGDIILIGLIHRDSIGQTVIDAGIKESDLVIGDTLWKVKPASIRYHDKVIDVEGFSICRAERHINIGGRLSRLATDTLKVELADIDLSYIMDLVNFHKIDFDGKATGNIYATSLMQEPFADAFLQVENFNFNEANLGDMDLYANWGRQERAIQLEADMRGPLSLHRTQLRGTIIPGRGAADGLNLNIRTNHIDLAFLNKYTKGIFRDLQGRASGWARVFGPFKKVNLEGDMFIDELKTHVLATGTDYRLAGDSVIMRPDNIWLHGARLYDNAGTPGVTEHSATVEAHMMHNAFKNFSYDVSIEAHNLLGYNFPHQGSMNFFGTVYADANVHLSGMPGTVNIDVAATPMPGTVIEYNTGTTGSLGEAEFVTYTSLSPALSPKEEEKPDESERFAPSSEVKGGADLRINFDINANPNAQIRILMDSRSGSISLYGSGRLRASYYNKGRFQLFGTYRVSDGTYRLSIRDLITKDFTFQPDGTIDFRGDPMQASLNLKAKHTVPNVSLDELSATGLGLSNTRVDCIMNLGGIAREPLISFDFDIPNANEDEKQMVRSLLTSKEERDMQAIYLLGVGRFYSYGGVLSGRQNQGGIAMNSVLSSTISSRFNQIMSQALGGTGWSFGTNLRTGENGWERLDVEGLVSGKMLSGRLLLNGNFGYRESKYRMGTGNFIGDFDIQYRLSPRSPLLLKAYSQTNDRYFTQSSLTTQGIGLKFQRDFNRWQELFHRVTKKKKKK